MPRSAARTSRAEHQDHDAACGCAVQDGGRKAVGVDQDLKTKNLHRLRRIEGQVRGLQRMVEEDRYCAEILTQVSSVQEALRAVASALLRNHLRHCVTHAVARGPDEATYDELVALFERYAKG